jgi:hypothetical protein
MRSLGEEEVSEGGGVKCRIGHSSSARHTVSLNIRVKVNWYVVCYLYQC